MTNRIDNIPNRGCPPTVLRRRHWRGGKRVRKETIANPARDPDWLVEGIRSLVKAGTYQAKDGEPPGGLKLRRTLPHSHAAAILGTLKSLGFKRILAHKDSCNRCPALAVAAAWIADPLWKLGTARLLVTSG